MVHSRLQNVGAIGFGVLCMNFKGCSSLDLKFGAFYTHVNGSWHSCGYMLFFVCYLQCKQSVTSHCFSHATAISSQTIGQSLMSHNCPTNGPNLELVTFPESS